MIGNLLIDGVDAYLEYGVFVVQDGHKEVFEYPLLKNNVLENNWHEYDGVEIDELEEREFSSRTLNIDFACIDSNKVDLFFEMLASGSATKTFLFFNTFSFNYRLVSNPKRKVCKNLEIFSLKFSEDYRTLYAETNQNDVVKESDLSINGKLFSDFSTYVLAGSYDDIQQNPEVKENLVIEITGGQSYGTGETVFEKKDVKLNLLMITNSFESFRKNYYALQNEFLKKGLSTIGVNSLLSEFDCYYKSCSVKKIAPTNNGVWFEFSLTFTFTNFRNKVIDILVTEDGRYVTTEESIDEEITVIQLN